MIYVPPPGPPLNLTATPGSSGQINLAWSAAVPQPGTTITGYTVYRQNQGNWPPLTTVSGTTISLADTGLIPSTSFSYRLVAIASNRAFSSPSNTANAIAPSVTPDITPPAIPPQPTLIYQNGTNYLIGWPPSVDPDPGLGATVSGTRDYPVTVGGVVQAPAVSDTASIAAPTLSIIGTNNGGSAVTGTDNGAQITATSTTGDTNAQHFKSSDEFVYVASIARAPVVVALHITAETLLGSFSKRGVEARANLDTAAPYVNFFSFGPGQGAKGEQRSSSGVSATAGASIALPVYPFWLRLWMDTNGLLTRDYSTNSVTGALGDGLWTVYDTQTPNFGPAFYIGRFADPETSTSGATGGTTSCTFDKYYTSGLAGLVYAGTGTAGQTIPVTVAAEDNALNLSNQSTPISIVIAGSSAPATKPFPSYGTYMIGGSQSGQYRYDYTTIQTYLRLFRCNIMNWEPRGDSIAAMPLKQVMQNTRGGAAGTKNFVYWDPVLLYSFNNASFLTAVNTNGWYVYNSFSASPRVNTVFSPPLPSFVGAGNLVAGGPTDSAGRTYGVYVPAFCFDVWMNGGPLNLGGQPVIANPFIDGFYMDDMHANSPVPNGDWLRNGSTNQAAIQAAIQQGTLNIVNGWRNNGPYTVLGGGNGGGDSIASSPVPSTYLSAWDLIILEGANGGVNSQESFGFSNFLNAYQRKQSTLKNTAGHDYFVFCGGDLGTDGSDTLSYNSSTKVVTRSAAWQGARQQWVSCMNFGNSDYFPSATDQGSIFNGEAYNSSIANQRWFDWYSCNPTTGMADSQVNGNAHINWLGAPLDPPQTTATQNGCFRRRFSNGETWYNPRGNGSQPITFGRSLRNLTSGQDPTMDGQLITGKMLAERDGYTGLYAA